MNEHAAPNKFRRYRDRKRAAGLREVRMWVPDLRHPYWKDALAREAASIAASRGDPEWDAHVESEMASWGDWTWPDDEAR